MKTNFTLPAGTYYIGDPCYVFPNKGPNSDKWVELLEACNYFEKDTCFGEIPNIKVWGHATKYGDGSYYSNIDKKNFYVDSGMLGIVPIETVKFLNNTETDPEVGGLFHTFETPFEIEFEKNDRFLFGSIIIFDEELIDEEEEDYYDDDDDEVETV